MDLTWRAQTTPEDLAAIREFEAALPGWWWAIGSCSVSRHASCAPDRAGVDAALLDDPARRFESFDIDLRGGTLGDALRTVMCAALKAKAGRSG